MNLAGRTVLLTGATGGLGHAIARRLRAAGAELVLTGPARRGPRAARRRDGRALAGRRPRRRARRSQRLASECADVDVLVSNAGLPGSGLLTSFSVEEIDRALAVNLRAPMVLARALSRRWSRAAAATWSSCPRWPARSARRASRGLQRDEVRPARARAEPARGPAPERRRRQRDLPRLRARRGHVPRHWDEAPAGRRHGGAGRRRRRGRPRDRAQPRRDRRRAGRACAPAPRRPGWPPTSRRRCSASSAGQRIAEDHVSAQTTKR